MLIQYHKYGSINSFRVLIIYSFILYMLTLYFLIILPLPNINDVVYKPGMIKLIPFTFIVDFIKETSLVIGDASTYIKALCEPCFYTVIFNLFMTIPFGIYLRYYFRCDLKKTIKYTFLLSLFFELTQLSRLYFIYRYQYRVFDVDDLMINTLGGVIGYYVARIFTGILPTREKIDESSLRAGMKVSVLRRLIMFELDAFLFLSLYIFLSITFSIKHLFVVIFIIYYVIIPFISNGYTFGSKFLNVKLEYECNIFKNTIFRIVFMYIYYFGLVYFMFSRSYTISAYLSIDKKVFFYLGIFLVALLFYLINIICLIKNKKMFYDKLFKVKYVSTLNVDL